MREKLIELLDEVHKTHLGKEYRERLGTIADYLIANGVTIPVRCKDCKHYVIRALACRNEHMNGVIHMNGFCSYGERRTDE